MVQDLEYYLTKEAAAAICSRGDREGLAKMFSALATLRKDWFFRRVIFTRPDIPRIFLEELAEEAFLRTWDVFVERVGDGRLLLKAPDYSELFFTMFKRRYWRLLAVERNRIDAERGFGHGPLDMPSRDEAMSFRTLQALNKLGDKCRELLIWRYVEDLSHDDIAARRNIDRSSSIKMVSRCGQRFAALWHNYISKL